MDIEWQDGAVCFAGLLQFGAPVNGLYPALSGGGASIGYFNRDDFQLNTIKQGDYIEASELDTEQKYNDAVEVFGLFGFYRFNAYKYGKTKSDFESGAKRLFLSFENYIMTSPDNGSRKLTYQQLMAIGELKRLELERKRKETLSPKGGVTVKQGVDCAEKSAPKIAPDLVKDGSKYHREIIGLDGVKTTVDVYRVLDAFKTGCAATDHAIKKMLCAGLRGHKDKLTDYDNAIESLQAAKELLLQKEAK